MLFTSVFRDSPQFLFMLSWCFNGYFARSMVVLYCSCFWYSLLVVYQFLQWPGDLRWVYLRPVCS